MYLKSFFQSQKKETSATQQQGLEPLQNQVKELKEMIEKILIIVVEQRETINNLTKQQDEQKKLLEIIQNQQGNMDTQIQQSNQLINSLKLEFSEINKSTITLLEMEERQAQNTQAIWEQQDIHFQKLFQHQTQQKDQPKEQFFQNVNNQSRVIITTGTKYHKFDCNSLKKHREVVDLNDAVKQGLTPCAICKP